MNASDIANDSSTITLWSVSRPGRDVRCVIDAVGSGASLRGTARMLVDGADADSHTFADIHELIEVNANWRFHLKATSGEWQ